MTPEIFIEKAIEGGWKVRGAGSPYSFEICADNRVEFRVGYNNIHKEDSWIETVSLEKILLDKDAWKAVGKVEGWRENCKKGDEGFETMTGAKFTAQHPKTKMLNMYEAILFY